MGQSNSNNNSSRPSKLSIFTSLCVGSSDHHHPQQIPLKPQQKPSSCIAARKARITLVLDRALVKLSRKNLAVDQFTTDSNITSQIQNHLSSRVSGLPIVVLNGQFSDKFAISIPFCIRALNSSRAFFIPISEAILTKGSKVAYRAGAVDCLVLSVGKSSQKLIEATLRIHFKTVQNFIFVVEEQIEILDYLGLFAIYKSVFMFQIEKVMVMNKCQTSIIYVSKNLEFLKIPIDSLTQYLVEELSHVDSGIPKAGFRDLLKKLLEAKFCLETASALGQLLSAPKSTMHYDEQFIYRMQKKHPESQAIIQQFLLMAKQGDKAQRGSSLPRFYENTPEFKMDCYNNQICFRESGETAKSNRKLVGVSFGFTKPQQANTDFA